MTTAYAIANEAMALRAAGLRVLRMWVSNDVMLRLALELGFGAIYVSHNGHVGLRVWCATGTVDVFDGRQNGKPSETDHGSRSRPHE